MKLTLFALIAYVAFLSWSIATYSATVAATINGNFHEFRTRIQILEQQQKAAEVRRMRMMKEVPL